MTTTVVHCKRNRYDIYIGRPSKWGNPFKIGIDGNRDQVIAKYRQWLTLHPEIIALAKVELKDKILSCWCTPKFCHGDILAAIVNGDE